MDEQQQKEYLQNINNDLFSIKQNFLDFKIKTGLSLRLSQLQFFQTISGIVLALISINLGLDYLNVGVLMIYTVICSILLLIVTTAFTREIIDEEINGLEKAEAIVNENHNQVMKKIQACLEVRNINPMVEFSKKQISKKKEIKEKNLIFTGEIIVFLFFNTIFSSFILLIDKQTLNPLYFIVLTICVSYLLSFKTWSLKFVKFLSKSIFNKSKTDK